MAMLIYQTNSKDEIIKATANTFLKKLAIQVSELPDNEKVAVPMGKEYRVLRYCDESQGHILIELDYKAGIWYIYTDHWDIPWIGSKPIAVVPIDWNDMSSPITAHFTVGENLRDDRRRIPTSDTVKSNILKVMTELEKIRIDYGKPIKITSGYRPKAINQAIGGASQSRHIQGDAVDIAPVSGDVFDFQRYLDKNWYGALGYGAQKGFVHIDCRNGKGWKTGGSKGPRWNY